MRNNIVVAFIALLLVFSCKKKNTEVSSTSFKVNNIEQQEEVQSKDIVTTDLKVDIKNIKRQVDNVTTSFLSKKDTEIFIKKPKDNFFGVYYLIKGDLSNIVGKMIVYDDINPYKYNKDTDEFIEINLWKRGVKLLDDSIEVGMTKKLLIERLGNIFKVEKDILIFDDKPIKGFFKLKEDYVTNIKIGFYNTDTTNDDILKYEW
ncbi:hypothetical protein [uncultured Algibacter sp.]|uniref:hypothetical protein n=1 Tax=uncultured Algibacter sp. TaxID=298659 RepID=UPI00262F3BEF|nr:hypothetical protein [uncultured Algibacter sp.]